MKFPKIIFVAVVLALGAGCNPTKHLKDNQVLYTGASVKIEGDSLTARQRKTLRADLAALTRPKPNSRVLGIPLKLNIYNLFHNKSATSFWGKLRDKYGEPPVLLEQVDLERNNLVLRNFMENKGYFHAKVTSDTVVRRRRARAEYVATPGAQYIINQVQFPQDSSQLALNIKAAGENTLLQKGQPFDLELIKAERLRIDNYLKERGFYYFSPDYILVRTDSTIGNNLVNMYLVIKPETRPEAQQIFSIRDVFIYSNYSLNTARLDTSLANSTRVKGYTIVDRRNRFKPYVFEESMQFQAGDVYNRTDHNQTLSRLISLNTFKFVKNRFEPALADSPMLDVYYYLTPLPKQSLSAEFTFISRDNNLNGSQINLNFLNRNIFRSASQLNLKAYVGSDVQFSGALKGYNTYRTGAELTLAIPRLMVPGFNLRRTGPFAPRTNVRIGYDILNRKSLYTLNSYRFEYGFNWKKNAEVQYEFYPFSVNYVQPLNVTKDYDSLARIIPGLTRAIEQQFILGSYFRYNLNQLTRENKPVNAYYFNGLVDLSGNIAGLFSRPNVKKGDTAFIRNVPFSQYIKLEADGRWYRRIGLKSTWANRLLIGFGMPYGNSTQIPYVKQFFIGGNNSLRGFRSRGVGPGTYFPVNANDFIPDQTGDIKFEANTEFRPHITGPLYGAVFLEAGNIWLYNDSTYTQKPGAQFSKNFAQQLAVDAGVGIRLDITVFVIRLDVGFPLRKPWEQSPWVANQIDPGSATWRSRNLVYNLAIGYPF